MVSEWVLAAGTVVLAGFTAVLAWTTWHLYKATRRLSRIEEERDKMVQRQRRKEKLSRKLMLARALIGTPWEDIADPLSQGRTPGPARKLRQLAELVDEGDQVLREDLGRLLSAFNATDRRTSYSEAQLDDLEKNFERTTQRLGWDLQGWEDEVVVLSKEPG